MNYYADPGKVPDRDVTMRVMDVGLIVVGGLFTFCVGCGPDSSLTDLTSADAGVDVFDAVDGDDVGVNSLDSVEVVDAEVLVPKKLCERCDDDSECVDGSVCVSIDIPSLKECHRSCKTNEDCQGSECVGDDGRRYCNPDEPCYPRCQSPKPFLDIYTATCVECLENTNCLGDKYCGDDGTCTCPTKDCDSGTTQCDDCVCGACCQDADCDSTEVCWEHSCVDPEARCDNTCAGEGRICHVVGGAARCVDCLTDSDCPEGCTCTMDPLWACTDNDGAICF